MPTEHEALAERRELARQLDVFRDENKDLLSVCDVVELAGIASPGEEALTARSLRITAGLDGGGQLAQHHVYHVGDWILFQICLPISRLSDVILALVDDTVFDDGNGLSFRFPAHVASVYINDFVQQPRGVFNPSTALLRWANVACQGRMFSTIQQHRLFSHALTIHESFFNAEHAIRTLSIRQGLGVDDTVSVRFEIESPLYYKHVEWCISEVVLVFEAPLTLDLERLYVKWKTPDEMGRSRLSRQGNKCLASFRAKAAEFEARVILGTVSMHHIYERRPDDTMYESHVDVASPNLLHIEYHNYHNYGLAGSMGTNAQAAGNQFSSTHEAVASESPAALPHDQRHEDAELVDDSSPGTSRSHSATSGCTIFSRVDYDAVTMASRAARLIAAPEISERFIAVAPTGAWDCSLPALLSFVMSSGSWIAPPGDTHSFPPAALLPSADSVRRVEDGLMWSTEIGHKMVAATDGSIALRFRLAGDRQGKGGARRRGEVGLFTTLEQLAGAIIYGQALSERLSIRSDVNFRLELHPSAARLMCEPSNTESQSSTSLLLCSGWPKLTGQVSTPIRFSGVASTRMTVNELSSMLDTVAHSIGAFFGTEEIIDAFRPGTLVVPLFRDFLR